MNLSLKMIDWYKPYFSAVKLSLLFCLYSLLSGCTLPTLEDRTVSTALDIDEAKETRLGRAIAPEVAEYPNKSGIYPLQNSLDAFAARVLLAEAAERTLDIQYFIWRDGITGKLLLEALLDAARRGVRVRLLLDDFGISGLDDHLVVLDSHSNIEVRLFNPFVVRNPKWLGFVTDFSRANRRMHNKSFTADNQAAIIGGRNVGDEYFGAGEGMQFVDLDVLAIGPVVNEVSTDFDRYWASESSYPVDRILSSDNRDLSEQLPELNFNVDRDPASSVYINAIRHSDFVHELLEGRLTLNWANTRMISDDPAKGLGEAEPEELMPHHLEETLGLPTREVILVSPYFVPTATGTEAIIRMVKRGVRVRILTNSLDATDVAVVHAGYVKHRKALLQAGVELYEMRRLTTETDPGRYVGPFASSASGLHAKTFGVDGERVFVGSFNFDPRSANLNTELGFVIDSPVLAHEIEVVCEETWPSIAYEVRLSEQGEIYWLEQREDRYIRYDKEPHTGFWKRSGVYLLSFLPIEWLL